MSSKLKKFRNIKSSLTKIKTSVKPPENITKNVNNVKEAIVQPLKQTFSELKKNDDNLASRSNTSKTSDTEPVEEKSSVTNLLHHIVNGVSENITGNNSNTLLTLKKTSSMTNISND